MTPPQLTGDAPVLNVAHPAEVHVLVLFGHELDAAVFNGGNGGLGQRLGGDVPLVGQPRLDDHARAVALGHLERMGFDLFEQAEGVEVFDDLLARLEAIQTGVGFRQGSVDVAVDAAVDVEHLGAGQDGGVLVQHVDQRQAVALADFVVVEVVGRGHLHAAGTEFRVAVVVGDDRDAATHQWQLDKLADQRLIAFVFRVNRNCAVTQHGFRASGGDDQIGLAVGGSGAISQRVAQVPQRALLVVVFHFQIGNRGVQFRVPIDQALAAVDQAVLMQAHEGFLDRLGQAIVHGEAFAAPVYRTAKATNLASDVAARLFLPFPDLFEEFLAAQVMAADALCSELALNHHLGGDTGMVGARLPQGVAALHTAEADQRVHDRIVEAVTHVQATSHVRRRQGNGVGLARALRGKVVVLLPGLVPGSFDGVGLVSLVHGCRGYPAVQEWRALVTRQASSAQEKPSL